MQTVMEFAKPRPQVRTVRRADGWWVTGLPDEANQEIGSYATRAEADEALRGMVAFFTRNPSYADWPIATRCNQARRKDGGR